MNGVEHSLAVADGAEDLLARDDVPDANQSTTCLSCDAPLVGLYCHACGNKNDDYRRSIWQLIVEMFTNITALDARVWRTLRSLILRPGQVARDYADGARTRWTSPVRFYLATSLMLFGYIALSNTQLITLGGHEETTDGRVIPAPAFFQRLDDETKARHRESTDRVIKLIERETAFESATETLNRRLSVALALQEENADAADQVVPLRRAIALVDTQYEFEPDLVEPDLPKELDYLLGEVGLRYSELEHTVGDKDSTLSQLSYDGGRDMGGGMARAMLNNPERINGPLNAHLKLSMLFMLPLAMLLGAIFVHGREKAMLYDHLIHASYIHGVSFLLLLVFILLHQFVAIPWLIIPYTLTLLVYLPMSTRGMFGRGWFHSTMTAYIVGATYTFVIFLVAVLIAAFAMFGTVEEVRAERQAVQLLETEVTRAADEVREEESATEATD